MKRTLFNQFYDRAIEGLPLVGTPEAAAERFRDDGAAPADAAERLTQRYVLLCGATGFVCGLPGYMTMVITIPSNVAGVALLQLHLCAAIARLDERDLHDKAVRILCVDCVLDDLDPGPKPDETQGLLRRVTTKLGERGLRFASEQAARWAGRRVRSLPLVGGVAGGYTDARSTQAVGRRARRVFLDTARANNGNDAAGS